MILHPAAPACEARARESRPRIGSLLPRLTMAADESGLVPWLYYASTKPYSDHHQVSLFCCCCAAVPLARPSTPPSWAATKPSSGLSLLSDSEKDSRTAGKRRSVAFLGIGNSTRDAGNTSWALPSRRTSCETVFDGFQQWLRRSQKRALGCWLLHSFNLLSQVLSNRIHLLTWLVHSSVMEEAITNPSTLRAFRRADVVYKPVARSSPRLSAVELRLDRFCFVMTACTRDLTIRINAPVRTGAPSRLPQSPHPKMLGSQAARSPSMYRAVQFQDPLRLHYGGYRNVKWHIEELLKSRVRKKALSYLVKWYGRAQPSWESRSDLINCDDLLARFHHEHPRARGWRWAAKRLSPSTRYSRKVFEEHSTLR